MDRVETLVVIRVNRTAREGETDKLVLLFGDALDGVVEHRRRKVEVDHAADLLQDGERQVPRRERAPVLLD